MDGIERQEQLMELKQAMKETDNKQLYKRYHMVWQFLTGRYSQKETARIEGVTPKTVATHVTSYLTGGLDALKPKPIPGRVRRLTPAQEEELAETIANKLPSQVGFERLANWTLALAVEYTRKTWGVEYSLKGMSLILERQGLSHTRPTYTLAKADPKKQAEFKEEVFPEVKKN